MTGKGIQYMDPATIDRANLANQMRWQWCMDQLKGAVLEVGSGSGEMWKHARPSPGIGAATLLDIAGWDTGLFFPFVRCDACDGLPFDERAFDTVLISEVLEHVHCDPLYVMGEAARVARERIVVTVPHESDWEPGVFPFMTREEHLQEGEYEIVKAIPALKEDVDELQTPHHWHIRQFEEVDVDRLSSVDGWKVVRKEHRRDWKPFCHFGVVMERIDHQEVEAGL